MSSIAKRDGILPLSPVARALIVVRASHIDISSALGIDDPDSASPSTNASEGPSPRLILVPAMSFRSFFRRAIDAMTANYVTSRRQSKRQ